jgi:outer membrane immunogenic protein
MVAGQTVRHRRQEWTRNENLSMKFTILTLAACTTLTAPVFAADMAPAIAPGPPVFASNSWEGFYVGGHVGGIFAGSSSFASDPSSVPSIGQTTVVGEEHIDNAHQLGPLSAGFVAGYNYVTASGLLLGVAADFSFPAILRSNLQQNIAALGPSVVNDNVQIFGSLGGRVGYVFGDWLVYGAGGFAYNRDRLNTTEFATGSVDDNVYFWRPGLTAGAGVEVLLTANLSAKLEYDFFDFARVNTYLPVAGEHYNSNLAFQTLPHVRLAKVFDEDAERLTIGELIERLPVLAEVRVDLEAMAYVTDDDERRRRMATRQEPNVVLSLAAGVEHQHVPRSLSAAPTAWNRIGGKQFALAEQLLCASRLLAGLFRLKNEGPALIKVDAPGADRSVARGLLHDLLERVIVSLGRRGGGVRRGQAQHDA